ncbi:TRAP transporter small permease [Comamonadaceae bacterium G21597-S1]|nr:TRAP transporter small permease [Comamonadaceae bacterium G21597-S1]
MADTHGTAQQRREGPALRALGHVVRALAGAGMAVAAASLLLSLCLIGWAVVMRYVFNAAPVWVDEVVGFLLVAIVMLAAARTLRRGEHIGVDLLVDRLSLPARRWTQAWSALAVAVVACVLIINGWGTASLARMLGLVTEGNLEWPTWMLMLLMPVGGALLLLAAVEVFWRAVAGLPALGKSTDHGQAEDGA